MGLWTLKYGGTEQTLEAWGFLDDFQTERVNRGPSTVHFRTNERFDPGAPQFTSFPAWFRANPTGSPASQLALMYRDRTSVGNGGSIYFAGYFDDAERVEENGQEHIEYQLHNVLWLFERNPFKQQRKQVTSWTTPGDPTSGGVLTSVVCPEVFLGEKVDETQMKQFEQLQEIIDWMNESYNPTRRGAGSGMDATKDVAQAGTLNPAVKIPKDRANTIFCMEAINRVLRWAPDALLQVDDTTTPPTVSVVTMSKWNYATDPPTFVDYTNLPEVTINITTQQEKMMRVQTQASRQLPGVILYYLSSTTIDGSTVPAVLRKEFPVGISDYYPEVPSHAVELSGSTKINVKVTPEIHAMPIADAVSATLGDRLDWWVAHNPALGDEKIDFGSMEAEVAEVKDTSGAAITLADYPNELLKPLPQWAKDVLGLRTVVAIVTSKIKYDRYREEAKINLDISPEHLHTKRVTLTNALAVPYSAVKYSDPGETPPDGVEESIYRAMAVAQGAGTIILRGDQLRSDIYIGCRLKLVGPNTTFTNILPQQITEQPCQGITTVQFGPSAIMDAETLIELARATRFRAIYNMPTGRADGMPKGSPELDHTMDNPLSDTSHGAGGGQFIAFTADA